MVSAENDFSFCMKTLLDRLVEGEGVHWPHCGVCMRGEEEITLVPPRRVKELIQYHGFKIFEPIESRVAWACVLCESSAAHALRAHTALRCAARVAALVTDLRLGGTGTACNTRGANNTEARRVKWRECEAMLRSVRGARRLVRTDVLLVDSTGVRTGGPDPGPVAHRHKRAAIKTPSRLQTIAPLNFEIETVIVDDDEDPLAMPPALPVLGPPSTAPPTAAPPSTGKLVQLTPLVSLYNASNVLYVPQHTNNQDVIVFIDNNCTVQKDDIAQLMLKGTDDGARKRARLGGAGGGGSPNHYVVDIDDVTGMIKEQSRKKQSQDESRSPVPIRPAAKARGTGKGTDRGTERGTDRGTERGIERGTDRGTERGTDREAGRAVPSGARVDWEDKIPMDVISFMDATDPHAAELIVPERGLARGGTWDPPLRPDPPIIDLS